MVNKFYISKTYFEKAEATILQTKFDIISVYLKTWTQ